jgi:hypothetical protein
MSQSPFRGTRKDTAEVNRGVILAGTALASFATLLLELALTRLFSVVLYYHFAFLAISLAMLGLGAGGVFSYVWRNWLAQWSLRELAFAICVLNSAAVLLALWVALHTRVLLILEPRNILRLTAIYATAGVPFFFTGLLFSLVFAREARHLALLYGADLTGGAFGCLAVVPLLNTLGGPSAVICAALALALAAGIWADTKIQRKISIGLVLLLIALVVSNHSQRAIDVVYAKGSFVQQSSVEFARWNALSRVEVFNWAENGKWANIDADASTLIVSADPRDPESVSYVKKWAPSSAIPNLLRPKGDYAIIGPGGGIDVLGAVVGGSPNVTGIEINPLIADSIVRGQYAGYAHHLYQLPQVHIHVSDGRSWIRASQDKYDVIQMTLVDTWASTSAGAFALSENNLYTVEAFREYFDHLKPDGFLAITRWDFSQPREALRVVSQAIEVLRRLGVEDVHKHFIVVANGRPDERGSQVTVLAKKTPFTIDEEGAVLKRVQSDPNLYPLYTPNVYGQPDESLYCRSPVHIETGGNCIEQDLAHLPEMRILPSETREPFQQLINLPSRGAAGAMGTSPRGEFIQDYPFEITPVTDNAPFFFFTFKTRSVLRTLLTSGGRRSIDWKNNLGLVILGIMLIVSIVAVAGFLIVPLALCEETRKPPVIRLLYFVAIGIGFILVEISLIQRFVLFLGHPTYAITVVVFMMLLSGGMGSFISKSWLKETVRVRAILAIIVVMVMLYVFLLPTILSTLVALSFSYKVALSAALLVPLGFLMGMPFPTGLREIAGHATAFSEPSGAIVSNAIEWAWAMNAASSVLGSVLAIVIALHFGLDATLGCAAGSYFVAAVLTAFWQRPCRKEAGVKESTSEICVEV